MASALSVAQVEDRQPISVDDDRLAVDKAWSDGKALSRFGNLGEAVGEDCIRFAFKRRRSTGSRLGTEPSSPRDTSYSVIDGIGGLFCVGKPVHHSLENGRRVASLTRRHRL